MLINTVRIRNFRTIAEDFTFRIDNKCALIGPNNVGKSNILQAIHLFFSLHDGTITNRGRTYSKQVDFPSFSTQSGKTTILMIFQCENDENDKHILQLYNNIRTVLNIPGGTSSAVSILLTFSESGRHTYQLFPNTKRPQTTNLEEMTESFFDKFFGNIAIHYLQSDKRFHEIYHELLLPSVKLEIAENLSTVYETVKNSISSVNLLLNKYMNEIDLSSFSIRLTAPDRVADLIQDIKFRLQDEDEIESELESKGMGIQSLVVTASMLWLQQFYKKNGRSVVWLIEEPESFLHPNVRPVKNP